MIPTLAFVRFLMLDGMSLDTCRFFSFSLSPLITKRDRPPLAGWSIVSVVKRYTCW